ncbi:hypothetical protein BJF78_04915 [Pseudonocardia sp. CNS-139]|nr:hypothetical protein BJF78_04915 [Pseudonocardia sp. CNS-139]
MGTCLDLVAPGLGMMANESHRHAPVLAVLADAAHPTRAGAHLLALVPERDAGVRGLTTDVPRVRMAAQEGYRTVTAALRRVAATA